MKILIAILLLCPTLAVAQEYQAGGEGLKVIETKSVVTEQSYRLEDIINGLKDCEKKHQAAVDAADAEYENAHEKWANLLNKSIEIGIVTKDAQQEIFDQVDDHTDLNWTNEKLKP